MTPVVVVWSLQQTITRRGGLTYLLERFGFANRTARRATPVWFHAASVGEMRLATPLISEALEHADGFSGSLLEGNTLEALVHVQRVVTAGGSHLSLGASFFNHFVK